MQISKNLKLVFIVITAILLCFHTSAFAQEQETNEEDYFDLSIEELMDVQVTTPSRKPQSVDTSPSNITVITEEEINLMRS